MIALQNPFESVEFRSQPTDWVAERELGRGAFGSVDQLRNIHHSVRVARKARLS